MNLKGKILKKDIEVQNWVNNFSNYFSIDEEKKLIYGCIPTDELVYLVIINIQNQKIVWESTINIPYIEQIQTNFNNGKLYFVIKDYDCNLYYGVLNENRYVTIRNLGNYDMYGYGYTYISNIVVENNNVYFVVPWFTTYGYYDDNRYYQKKGNWYLFHINENGNLNLIKINTEDDDLMLFYNDIQYIPGSTIEFNYDLIDDPKKYHRFYRFRPTNTTYWVGFNSIYVDLENPQRWYPNTSISVCTFTNYNIAKSVNSAQRRIKGWIYGAGSVFIASKVRRDIYAYVIDYGYTSNDDIYYTIDDVGKIFHEVVLFRDPNGNYIDKGVTYRICNIRYYKTYEYPPVSTYYWPPLDTYDYMPLYVFENTGKKWYALPCHLTKVTDLGIGQEKFKIGEYLYYSDSHRYLIYECIEEGFTSGTIPPIGKEGDIIVDGEVKWRVYDYKYFVRDAFVVEEQPFHDKRFLIKDYGLYLKTTSVTDEINKIVDIDKKLEYNVENQEVSIDVYNAPLPLYLSYLTNYETLYNIDLYTKDTKLYLLPRFLQYYPTREWFDNGVLYLIKDGNNFVLSISGLQYVYLDSGLDYKLVYNILKFDINGNILNTVNIYTGQNPIDIWSVYGIYLVKHNNYYYCAHTNDDTIWGIKIKKLDSDLNILKTIGVSTDNIADCVLNLKYNQENNLLEIVTGEMPNSIVLVDEDLNIKKIYDGEINIDVAFKQPPYRIRDNFHLRNYIFLKNKLFVPVTFSYFDYDTWEKEGYIGLISPTTAQPGLIELCLYYPYISEEEPKHYIGKEGGNIWF
ncbi:MAG: hypothetical protein NC901_02865 [Candidatus Omnitrophica bacterium]|nr:hypothetical protein [Candidatus Omnitrophota bacterium]